MKLIKDLKFVAAPTKIFMTVLILLSALLTLQFFIIEITSEFTRSRQATAKEPKLTPEEERTKRIERSTKEFSPDGTIYLVHREQQYRNGRYIESEQVYDPNGNLLRKESIDTRPNEYLSWAGRLYGRYGFSYLRVDFTAQQLKQMQIITPGFSQNIEIPVCSGDKTEQVWRYQPGRDIFIGYRFKGEKIGYFGSNGFTDSKSKAKPFGKFRVSNGWCPQESTSPTLLWQTQKRIYQINFAKQNVELLFESDSSDIASVALNAWIDPVPGTKEYFENQKYRPLLVCGTKDGKNHLIMRNPKQTLTISIPKDWNNWFGNNYEFTATNQGIYLRRHWIDFRKFPDNLQDRQLYDQWRLEYRSKPQKRWVELYKIDAQANLELVNSYDWIVPPAPGYITKARDPRAAVKRYVSQFSPLMYDLFIRYAAVRFWPRPYGYGSRNDFFYGFLMMISDISPHRGIVSRILSALMMVFVFWHGWPRRTSWAKFVFWIVFTGLFNIAGLLTYLALNHTAVIKCPVCGKRRGLDQVDCVRCSAQLPAPERGKLDLIFGI